VSSLPNKREFLGKIINAETTTSSKPRGLPNNQSDENEIPNKDLFIVMDLIKPVLTNNYIISPKGQQKLYNSNKKKLGKVQISNELGIYGVLVR
jgi:hypothetical protein